MIALAKNSTSFLSYVRRKLNDHRVTRPLHKVAGQVYYTDRATRKGLEQIPEKNQLTIDYESLCEKPQAVYSKIRQRYAEHDYVIEEAYSGPEGFENKNKLQVSKKEASDIVAAYEHFSGEKLKV